MARVICYFSGWFECNPETTFIRRFDENNNLSENSILMSEELKTNPRLDGVLLEQFEDASKVGLDGNFEELYLKIEKDDEEEEFRPDHNH
jgi:hypothetical protein